MKCIVANWKKHPATKAEAVALARASDFAGMVICPPHQFLEIVHRVIKNALLGAQDYAPDLSKHGVRYVIIGHSDRRAAGETDDGIAEKMARAVFDGLTPILCVGETREQRIRGEAEQIIIKQLRVGLSKISFLQSDRRNLIAEIWIAYEPVWAISTARGAEPATPENAVARIAFIKEQLLHLHCQFSVKFLYGGSVTSANAPSFLRHHDIDGLLVGAASIIPKEIKKIWQSAKK